MEVKIDLIKGELKIDGINIYELFEDLSEEDKNSMTGMFTWDRIFKAAVKRLTGESEDFCDSDKRITLDVLAKMETHLLSGYKWTILTNLESLAQNTIAHEHIYWKMYHEKNEGLKKVFREWFDIHKIKSNYMSDYPSYLDFKRFVENKLEEFSGVIDKKPNNEKVRPSEEIERVMGELEDANYHGDVRLKQDKGYVVNALRWVLYKEEEIPKR